MKKNKNKAIFRLVAKLLEVNENKININTSVKSLDEYDSLAILNII